MKYNEYQVLFTFQQRLEVLGCLLLMSSFLTENENTVQLALVEIVVFFFIWFE